jgi:hypothetical protein
VIGYRKLLAFIAGLVINGTLAWGGKIDPGVYSVVAVALAGGYFTANAVVSKKAA